MKTFIFLLSLLITTSLWGQPVISPASPKIDEEITITYNPNTPQAVLKDNISADVVFLGEQNKIVWIEVPLQKNGSFWEGKVKPAAGAQALFAQFYSGDVIDNDSGKAWSAVLSDSKGLPFIDGYILIAQVRTKGSLPNFDIESDLDAAKLDITKALEIKPNYWKAKIASWEILMKESPGKAALEKIKPELDAIYEANKNDEEVVAALLKWFERADKAKADKITNAAISANPKGAAAKYARMNAVMRERLPQRTALYEKYISDFPEQGIAGEDQKNTLAYYYLMSNNISKAIEILDGLDDPDWTIYSQIADKMVSDNQDMEKAAALAKKGVVGIRASFSEKPDEISSRIWNIQCKENIVRALTIYGGVLMNISKSGEAENILKEAYILSNGEFLELNDKYIECLYKNGNHAAVLEAADQCIRKDNASPEMIEFYKKSYTQINKNDSGFEAAFQDARATAKQNLKTKLLSEMLNKPEIDFELKDLAGNTIKLSDLKGKIVVLDFWATWCGPCRMSFPTLQKIYEKHKTNPDIVILAINTLERKSGAEKIEGVKKFISENKYTFRVLLDDEQTNIVGRYDVSGIPTKFIIDRNGIIRFKTVGFDTNIKMENELDVQFEILLSDNFMK